MLGRGVSRSDRGAWIDLPPSFAICTLVLHSLPARTVKDEPFYIPDELQPGLHRVRVHFGANSGGLWTSSDAFEVR